MYQCDGCGWATTGFRVEAVSAHESDRPDCLGTMRLVFHAGIPELDHGLMPGALRAIPGLAGPGAPSDNQLRADRDLGVTAGGEGTG
jgi:hypothetical protein